MTDREKEELIQLGLKLLGLKKHEVNIIWMGNTPFMIPRTEEARNRAIMNYNDRSAADILSMDNHRPASIKEDWDKQLQEIRNLPEKKKED